MDYELIIRPEAKADLLDTFRWYQEQRQGLGHDFNYVLKKSSPKFREILLFIKKYFKT